MPRSLLTALDNSVGNGTLVPVNAAGTVACEYDANRLCLIIGADVAADMILSLDPNAVWPNGIALVHLGNPFILTKELHGGLVCRRWFVSPKTGTGQVFVAEATDTHAPQKDKQ